MNDRYYLLTGAAGILGPNDHALGETTRTVLQIIKGEMPMGIQGSFNLCDVRDLAAGTIAAIDKGRVGECYILANEPVTLKEMCEMIQQECTAKKISIYLPLGLADKIAQMLEKQAEKTGKKPLMTTFSVYNLARNNVFDYSKAQRELGYTTRSYQETIHDEVRWLIEEGLIDGNPNPAKLTFGNVLLISFGAATIDYIRRKRMVDKPVQQIMDALDQVMQGDFSVRIDPVKEFAGETGFNEIIKAINKMTAELQGTETLRTDFIANVSHELKAPLAAMANLSTILRQPGISKEERMEYAKAISHSSRRLAALITNILKLNKLENQQIFPKHEAYDLSGVTLKADEKNVVVQVRDTGCGIDPETGKHIFEKFYQGDTPTLPMAMDLAVH